jgi:hypothetical protein
MPTLIFRWCIVVAVSAVTLAACSFGRSEAMKPEPQEARVRSPQQDPSLSVEHPPQPASRPDAGASGCASCGPRDQCVEGRCVCQPLTCLSNGKRCGQVSDGCGGVIECGRCSRCGPNEMDCCGTCIPRSEKRCPDNVHCPTAPPEM